MATPADVPPVAFQFALHLAHLRHDISGPRSGVLVRAARGIRMVASGPVEEY